MQYYTQYLNVIFDICQKYYQCKIINSEILIGRYSFVLLYDNCLIFKFTWRRDDDPEKYKKLTDEIIETVTCSNYILYGPYEKVSVVSTIKIQNYSIFCMKDREEFCIYDENGVLLGYTEINKNNNKMILSCIGDVDVDVDVDINTILKIIEDARIEITIDEILRHPEIQVPIEINSSSFKTKFID